MIVKKIFCHSYSVVQYYYQDITHYNSAYKIGLATAEGNYSNK